MTCLQWNVGTVILPLHTCTGRDLFPCTVCVLYTRILCTYLSLSQPSRAGIGTRLDYKEGPSTRPNVCACRRMGGGRVPIINIICSASWGSQPFLSGDRIRRFLVIMGLTSGGSRAHVQVGKKVQGSHPGGGSTRFISRWAHIQIGEVGLTYMYIDGSFPGFTSR